MTRVHWFVIVYLSLVPATVFAQSGPRKISVLPIPHGGLEDRLAITPRLDTTLTNLPAQDTLASLHADYYLSEGWGLGVGAGWRVDALSSDRRSEDLVEGAEGGFASLAPISVFDFHVTAVPIRLKAAFFQEFILRGHAFVRAGFGSVEMEDHGARLMGPMVSLGGQFFLPNDAFSIVWELRDQLARGHTLRNPERSTWHHIATMGIGLSWYYPGQTQIK